MEYKIRKQLNSLIIAKAYFLIQVEVADGYLNEEYLHEILDSDVFGIHTGDIEKQLEYFISWLKEERLEEDFKKWLKGLYLDDIWKIKYKSKYTD